MSAALSLGLADTERAPAIVATRPATAFVEAKVSCENCHGCGLVYKYGRGEDGDELECPECDATGLVIEWVAQ